MRSTQSVVPGLLLSVMVLVPGAPLWAQSAFDIQAHRGGLGLVTESTLQAFANALELGVSTLELTVW
jgi:glycerophosphoryl diester phosphodiesterase